MVLKKETCAQCSRSTAPFWKSDAGFFLCMKCWREEKSRIDPYFAFNDRLIEQAFHSDAGFEGLTEDEKMHFAVNELIQEVLNGGFHQYFYNSSGSRYQAAEAGLEKLNEPKILELLGRAREALFPGVVIPLDTAERRRMIPYAHESPGTKWGRVEEAESKRFAKLSDGLETRLFEFACEKGLIPADAKFIKY